MTMGKNSLLMALMGLAWNVTVFSAVDEPQALGEFYKGPIASETEHYEDPIVAEDHLDDPQLDFQNAATPMHLADAKGGSGQGAPMNPASVNELDFRVQIGGNYSHVNLTPHGHPSFRGNLGGAQGLFEYRPMDSFYGAAKLAWKEGRTHGDAGKRSLLYIDTQERLGYTFSFDNDDWLLTLFTGLGYRYLQQRLNPKEGASVRFKYSEFYVPLGFMTDYAVNSWFCVGLGFTWMAQIFPTVSIDPLKGNHWTLTNNLGNYSVELPFTFSLTKDKRFFVIVNPFYEHWEDGHTTAKLSNGTRLGLPGNSYNFWGADVNFAYCF